MRLVLIWVFLCAGLVPVWAQGQTLEGLIVDPEGHPIPYVQIGVAELNRSTHTYTDGTFLLPLPSGTHVLRLRHLGYLSHQDTVTVPQPGPVRFVLTPTDLQLSAVEIQGDRRDPAYGIMEQVIARKKDYLKQYDTYTCETYLRLSLRADSSEIWLSRPDSLRPERLDPVVTHLIESQSTTSFAAPNRFKSVVHGYRNLAPEQADPSVQFMFEDAAGNYQTATGDPYLFYQDVSEAEFNFYENLLLVPSLGDRPFVSPLNSTLWRVIYSYRLEETFMQDGRVHYRISVQPKSPAGPYFKGHLIIVDGLWAIHSLRLEILPSDLPFFQTFELQHHYEPDPRGRWLLREETYRYTIKDGKVLLQGESSATHQEYALEVSFPRNHFRNEVRRTEAEAFEQDSSFWAAVRPLPLGQEEMNFAQIQDSIRAYKTSPEYLREQDSIYNHLGIMDILFNGIGFRDRGRSMRYFFNPVISQPRPWGVGGYRHAIGGEIQKTWPRQRSVQLQGEVDYGFANRDIRGQGRVTVSYAPRRFARAFVRAGHTYDLVNDNETLLAVLGRGNFVEKRFVGVGHRMELVNGLYLDASVDYADRQAIDDLRLADWTEVIFTEGSNTPRSFDPYQEFLIELKLRYTPGQRYQMEPYRKVVLDSRWPTFTVTYRKNIPGIFGSDLNSDFLEVRADHEIVLGTLGRSRWNAAAGTFLQANNLRFTDYTFFRGSDPYLFANPLQAFQLLGTTFSTRNEYLFGHYLHDFGGSLVDRIPLLRRTPLQISGGAGTLYIRDGNFLHTELYAGLQWPFRIRKQRFKLGGYFVTSYSTYNTAIDAQFKVGIAFYNPVKRTWSY